MNFCTSSVYSQRFRSILSDIKIKYGSDGWSKRFKSILSNIEIKYGCQVKECENLKWLVSIPNSPRV